MSIDEDYEIDFLQPLVVLVGTVDVQLSGATARIHFLKYLFSISREGKIVINTVS